MDTFEQTFYKYTFKKSESQFENTNVFIQIYEARSPAIKREYVKMLAGLLEQENVAKDSFVGKELLGKLTKMKGFYE